MDRFSASGSKNTDLLADRLQRIRRVLRFAGERLRAIRQDHEAFWSLPLERAPHLGIEVADRVLTFKRKTELAERLLATGGKVLKLAEGQTAAAALVTAGRFDAEHLAATVRELDTLIAGVQHASRAFGARALGMPAHPPARPKSAGPAAPSEPRSASGRLFRWLQKLAEEPEVTIAAAMRPAPLDDGRVPAYLRELEAAAETARLVLKEVSTELAILRSALYATALPVPRRPWPEVPAEIEAISLVEQLDPVQVTWLTPVAKRLYVDADAVRRAHVCVTQWQDAQALMDSAVRHRHVVRTSGPDRQLVLMIDFHPGKLRASVLPLTHLPATFNGVPVLSRLFPPRDLI
ncbi:MAG: hypothetical protein JWM80_4617 [Cyanobacteria bacterium RYN_339]|nr:hypothetical protein [Cyanobacteria bacterium RYN_339]